MYFIAAMTNILSETTRFDSEEAKNHYTRCFGYFKDKVEAFDAVKNNYCDIFETCYWYVLVEYIPEGIHALSEEVGWFKYNPTIEQYEEIEQPKESNGFCNYSIG